MNQRNKGITLIALIITIIILLVLAIVSIRLVINGGIIEKANIAVSNYKDGEVMEQIKLAYSEWLLAKLEGNSEEPETFMVTSLGKIYGLEKVFVEKTTEGMFEIYITDIGKTYQFNPETGIASIGMQKWKQKEDGSFSNGKTDGLKIGDRVKYEQKLQTITLTENSQLIKDLKEYSGNTNSTLNTSSSIVQESGLEWKVFDIKDGKVRIICSTPTTSKVGLRGADGYNNAVYLLDEACDTLYTTNGIGKAQNLKIEDIEEKINKQQFDYTKAIDTSVYPNLAYNDSREYTENPVEFPNLYKSEIGCLEIGNSNNSGELGLSEQKELIKGITENNNRLVATNTNWFKLMEKRYFIDFKNSSSFYYSLLINNGTELSYWLSSRCAGCYSYLINTTNGIPTYVNYPLFSVRKVAANVVRGDYCMYANTSQNRSTTLSLRPIVTLDLDTELTGNSTNGWEIQ